MPRWIKVSALFLIFVAFAGNACAGWIWTPELGKWINPKKAAKDTPQAQFDWALNFYNQQNWDRAIEEFEKIPENFPTSRLAAEGVYYVGLCWEENKDIAKAADAYQRLVDRYPYSDRIKDAVKREFEIAQRFAAGDRVKVLGLPALPGQEKAIEIYKHIVKNAPFGSYGDQAQFNIGEIYKSQGEFEEAQKAFQAVVDEYPSSELVGRARYQIAFCSLEASKRAQYDERSAQRAIEEFQGFKENFPSDQQVTQADESIRQLRNKKAQTSFETAKFYEKINRLSSAKVYYQEVMNQYSDTPFAAPAKKKVEEILGQESKTQSKPGFRLW
jgi:outer membrane protein assembly factor BamD